MCTAEKKICEWIVCETEWESELVSNKKFAENNNTWAQIRGTRNCSYISIYVDIIRPHSEWVHINRWKNAFSKFDGDHCVCIVHGMQVHAYRTNWIEKKIIEHICSIEWILQKQWNDFFSLTGRFWAFALCLQDFFSHTYFIGLFSCSRLVSAFSFLLSSNFRLCMSAIAIVLYNFEAKPASLFLHRCFCIQCI